MSKNPVRATRAAVAFALVALAGTAGAATDITWTFPNAGGLYSAGGIGASATAWANTSGADGTANAEFMPQSLQISAPGLRVATVNGCASCEDGSSPNHAMDNAGAQEFILFAFDTPVALTALTISWPDSTYDTDMSVLAFRGTGIAPGAAANFTDGFQIADMTSLNSDRFDGDGLAGTGDGTGAEGGSTLGLTHAGWQLLAEPTNVTTNVGNQATFNAGGVASSYWLLGAYNQYISGSSYTFGNDYVKLSSLTGHTPEAPPPPGPHVVPEPATLSMLLLGLAGVRRSRLSKTA